MPYRAERVVGQVFDLLGERLHVQLGGLLDALGTRLAEDIRRERDPAVLGDWLDSRAALSRDAHRFAPLFLASLRQAVADAWDHVAPATGSAPGMQRIEPLRLLDEDIVDEEGALASIAARHESRVSLALVLLGQRFAVLLERPPLSARELPVGPLAFGRALRQAAEAIGLKLHGRMALYRLYDDRFIGHYDTLVHAVDAAMDGAGILPGLTYVPLPSRDIPDHPGRGLRAQAPADVHAAGGTPEVVAMRAVNAVLDRLVPAGVLPEARLQERREAVSAMVRLVTRHGVDSEEWRRCQAEIATVMDAIRERREVSPATRAWIRDALRALGYDDAEGQRLSATLANMGAAAVAAESAAAPGSDATRDAAAMDWRRRLASLPDGATLGFTREGGITRARLRRRGASLDRVLLANEDEGKEAWVDVDTVARLLADGHAWVVRDAGGSR